MVLGKSVFLLVARGARPCSGVMVGESGIKRPPQDPSPLRGTLGSSLRSPAEGDGHEGFPPPPDKAHLHNTGSITPHTDCILPREHLRDVLWNQTGS